MEQERVLKLFLEKMMQFRGHGFWVHVHVSTPCKTGSPLKRLNDDAPKESEHVEWSKVMTCTPRYMLKGDACSFELPTHNSIWKRPETCEVLTKARLLHNCEIFSVSDWCQRT